jgi:PAS domain S-box-containing protein
VQCLTIATHVSVTAQRLKLSEPIPALAAPRVADMMERTDWSATGVGPADSWPQSLKTVIRLMLDSRYAMWMSWGSERTFFCNDAYLPTVGVKRDWVLGARSDDVWKEIWPDIGPRIEHVIATGEATWDDGLLLFLERSGYPEETYHTFSYSPIYDDEGRVGGHLCVVTEDTDRVIGNRRLSSLRDLGAGISGRGREGEFAHAVERVLERNHKDLPFSALYLLDADDHPRLAMAAGIAHDHPLLRSRFDLPRDATGPRTGEARGTVIDLVPRAAELPRGDWDIPPRQALVVPIAQAGQARPAGMLVVGLNPYRALDPAYRDFIDLLAGQIAAGYADVRAYEQERLRAEALAEIDRAKTAFFSNVSHEFRTPLTLMLGPLEDLLARRGGAARDDADTRLVDVAHRNGVRLLKLVNTLLDFARLEAGRARASFVPVDLAAYTTELAANFESAMVRAGLEYRIDCPPLDRPVYVDRDMWEKIVLNLVSNAFKFTLRGSVSVSLRPSADGTNVELRVRDTGTGVPERELSHLFERFHRVEGARGRSMEGSGIGLALVQEQVKLHHGTVAVTSEIDRGSEFTVSIPFGSGHLPAERVATVPGAEAPMASASSIAVNARPFVEEALGWLPRQDEAPESAPALSTDELVQSHAGRGQRILLAEDNADMRHYVRRLLLDDGYQVEAVADGAAALDTIRAHGADLVLADVMMPELDGFGLLNAIRDDANLRATPVLLLSARAGQEARFEGLNAGADDYLTKPFSARELLVRVGSALQSARLRGATERALREEAHTLDIVNRVGIAIAAELDLGRAVQLVTDAATELTGAEFGAFFYNVTDTAGEKYLLYGLSGAPREAFEGFPMPRNTPIFEQTFSGKGVVRSEDVTRDPRYGKTAPWFGMPAGHLPVRSYLAVPVTSRSGEVIGGLFFGHGSPGVFTARAERLAVSIAAPAAIAIDNARLYEESQRAQTELAHLNGVLEQRVEQRTEQLRQSEQQFRLLVEGVTDYAIFMLDPDGNVATWNAGAEAIKGYSEAEIVGHHFSEFYTPEDRERGLPAQLLETAATLGTVEAEGWRVGKDGKRFWANVAINALHDADGELIGFAKITRDSSERRNVEEQLRQAQKMEAIGQLTGGVAHDFNNLLVIILGNIETLLRQLDRNDLDTTRIRRSAQNALRGAQRAASLTQRLLAFARRQSLEPKPVDVNRLVSNMSELLRRTLGEQITIETVLAGGMWHTHTDPNQLESAILNLAVNSRDAMPEGGKLTIETANTYLNRNYSDQNAEVTPGQYVAIAITDNGTGMTKEVLARVFEPFYTTKDVGHGTGLGLSQVYGFVKQSGGHVKVYSEPGEGTTVRLYLPRLNSADAEVEAPATPPAVVTGTRSETILVVEDDDDVRQHSTQLLSEMGYRVFEASNGQAALDILQRHDDIELLFTDIGLPGGMNGRQLADAAQQRWPALRVLYTTGYARNAIVHHGRLDPGVNLVTKPFTYDDLAARIAEMLDQDRDGHCVLVVEDDELVRTVIVGALDLHGYRVQEAATALEAANLIRSAGNFVDAVIVDIGLPDRRGDALAAELRTLHPKLPIIIATGYAESPLQERFKHDPCFRFLTKPYDTMHLADVLAEMSVVPPGAK